MRSTLSRRDFLRRSAAGAAAFAAGPGILSAATRKQQLHVACVGCKNMAFADLSNIGSHPAVKFVGFCDIDSRRFDQADAAFPDVPHFTDYREMIDQLGDSVDAIQVTTPDHTHAPAAMTAIRANKHVFVQKPLTHTVWEARQLRLAAEQRGLITQMGNQIHSHEAYRTGVRVIQEGAIGKIKEVHSWVGIDGRNWNGVTERQPEAPVPPEVDWNLWIGAAPMRPFAEKVYHPFNWRDWQDFGSGALGDFGCHILDPVFNSLGLTAPLSIRAEHEGTNDEVWPGPETVTYVFPGTERTAGETINVVWRDGGLKPDRSLAQMPDGEQLPASGSLFIGEQGAMVLQHVAMPKLFPVEKFADYQMPAETSLNHWHVWVDAVLAGMQTSDGFHYAGPLTEATQLGNVAALLPGRELVWDAEALKVTSVEEANALLTKEYRTGFEVEPA